MPVFESITVIAVVACIVCFGCGFFLGRETERARTLDEARRDAADTRYRLFTGRAL